MAFQPDSCLFVANLPHQFSNEQLGFHLYKIFKSFGFVDVVKTSRDSSGRPFAFVQFQNPESALCAAEKASSTCIAGRQLRIEKAKCQKKLYVKTPIKTIQILEEQLQKYICSSNNSIRVFFDENDGECKFTCAILKFNDESSLLSAQEEMRKNHPDWIISWLNPNRANANSFVLLGEEMESSNTATPFVFLGWSDLLSPPPPVPISKVASEKSLVFPSPPSTNSEIDACDEAQQRYEIFVGRLNRESISEAILYERFSKYGPIMGINLVCRDDPLHGKIDAYAIIRFESCDSASVAINEQNGTVWLGQAIKVTWAMPYNNQDYNIYYYNPYFQYNVPLIVPYCTQPPFYKTTTQ